MNSSALRCRLLISLLFVACSVVSRAQEPKKLPSPGPMLSQGMMDLDSPDFTLTLVRSSQTVAALKPKGADGFDFTPGDLLAQRSQNGYLHLGDLQLRLRVGDSGEWKAYSTATKREPVIALPNTSGVLATADLAPTLPADIPLQITRIWAVEQGKLVLRFILKNKSQEALEVGSLGIPMIFNNVLNDRTLEQAHVAC